MTRAELAEVARAAAPAIRDELDRGFARLAGELSQTIQTLEKRLEQLDAQISRLQSAAQPSPTVEP